MADLKNKSEKTPVAYFVQGDEDDQPETLSCPVIMNAETLRELLAKSAPPAPVAVSEHIRREVNVGGNTWVQCSSQAYERAKSEGKITRELYERHATVAVPDDVIKRLVFDLVLLGSREELMKDENEKRLFELVNIGTKIARAAMLKADGTLIDEGTKQVSSNEPLIGATICPVCHGETKSMPFSEMKYCPVCNPDYPQKNSVMDCGGKK